MEFLGFQFFNASPEQAVVRLLQGMRERQSAKVYFINAHSVVLARSHSRFARTLREADLILGDGAGVLWGSRLHGTPLRHNLNGTDLVPLLCREASKREFSVYLYGGKPGVALSAAKRLKGDFPRLRIVGTSHGFHPKQEEARIVADIRRAAPHLLLVAKGSPLQEFWIDDNKEDLCGVTCMGVGGLLDFLSGSVPRAPLPVRRVGMEWAWRMFVEPRRLWRRYLVGNPVYLYIVLKARRAARRANVDGPELPTRVS